MTAEVVVDIDARRRRKLLKEISDMLRHEVCLDRTKRRMIIAHLRTRDLPTLVQAHKAVTEFVADAGRFYANVLADFISEIPGGRPAESANALG